MQAVACCLIDPTLLLPLQSEKCQRQADATRMEERDVRQLHLQLTGCSLPSRVRTLMVEGSGGAWRRNRKHMQRRRRQREGRQGRNVAP